jgi:DNA-directed RNA polymerase sigma subunit (sigma70/sigma32)
MCTKAARLERLLQELTTNGYVLYSDVDLLCKDPEARAELDTFLSHLELTNATVLPAIEGKTPAQPSVRTKDADDSGYDPYDPLQVYLRELARVPALTAEREATLLQSREIQTNDAELAKKELVEANLGFVVSIAEDYQLSGVHILHLIETGNRGLIKAVDTFTVGRGYRLSTYIVLYVHQALAALLKRS